MVKESLIIAIDFDGTCVTHEYPKIGKDIGAVPILKKLIASGHRLMLWTMRGSKPNGYTLNDAINWFKINNIPLWGINENIDQKRTGWTNSNKQHANVFIDDAALGCPLKFDKQISERPFANWNAIETLLIERGLIEWKEIEADDVIFTGEVKHIKSKEDGI